MREDLHFSSAVFSPLHALQFAGALPGIAARFVEHCSWEKASPKLKDADRLPDASTVRRWSQGVDEFPAGAVFSSARRVRSGSVAGSVATMRIRRDSVLILADSGSRKSSGPMRRLRKILFPTILAWDLRRHPPTLGSGGEKVAVGEDVERLKRRMPLLDYLRQHNWTGRPAGRFEYGRPLSAARGDPAVVLCQHAKKCFLLSRLRPGRRPDSLRPVVPPSVLPSEPRLPRSADRCRRHLLGGARSGCAFYQQQLDHYPEALRYLDQRGLHDPALIGELGIGYAAGGSLRRHLTAQGYSFDLLRRPA